jgi:glucosamine--fructose-6-phosphate aminotransferase (isomerizing)
MCGIFAYSGLQQNATDIIYTGLKRLDYRGYDSWGIAVLEGQEIKLDKYVGKIDLNLPHLPTSQIGIGHTRWATHGSVTQINAHPHAASDNSFVLAQNGIVENFESLKTELMAKGYLFITQTDTEVIVRLIEDKKKEQPDLVAAVRAAFLELEGRNTIIILTKTGQIIAARNGSPLVLGTANQGAETYLSSDTLSFAPYVDQVLVVENGQLVTLTNQQLQLFNIKTGQAEAMHFEANAVQDTQVDTQGFDHFMIKEIFDTPQVIKNLLQMTEVEYQPFFEAVKNAHQVYTIGSGTAGAAAAQIAYYLRKLAHIPAVSLIGAEAQEYSDLFTTNDLIIAPSQSGETADVLEILEPAKQKGVKIASLVNMPGSMMSRMSDFKFMANAGPEICVVSTKVFTAQIAWGYLIAQGVAGKFSAAIADLNNLVVQIQSYLIDESLKQNLDHIAEHLSHKQHVFLLSKAQNLQIIKEGMVKIIESSYLHAHAIPAGDLKHYAITLMEPGVPVIFIISDDEVQKDVENALHEVKARGAEIIEISTHRHEQADFYLPVPDLGQVNAIMNIIPVQLLAYQLALKLGHDVDKPRNIAKSVTVK